MSSDLINVILIGHNSDDPETELVVSVANYEASGFSVLPLSSDEDIQSELACRKVHVICTFGDMSTFKELARLPIDVRKRWIHFDDKWKDLREVANSCLNVFVDVATINRFPNEPLVSVFTPTYKTGVGIYRAYQSLLQQSYENWEWIVYDDSPDGETWGIVSNLASLDPRIKLFRSDIPSGVIGEVKRRCCGLASGDILVELDHDDELTDHCLGDIVTASLKFPEAGFFYTDCAEVLEDGQNATYGSTYAFGFGSYRYEEYRGRTYAVSNYPSVNAKTVRHIVGMPNHARAWRRSAYHAAGGHGREIHVADDYELCIRTFLTTPMVHIKRLGYIQHLDSGGSNTQRVRNKEIQRLVRLFANRYESEIHARFEELGVDDFIWTENGLDWDQLPTDNHEANLTFR